MPNIVKTVVFPLTVNYDQKGRTDSSARVLYVTAPLDKLEKAVALSRGHTPGVHVNEDISVYPEVNSTFIVPKKVEYLPERVDELRPELYNFVVYEWLLEQIKQVEEGAKYTEYCLLQGSKLIVLNNGEEDGMSTPNTLINVLSTTLGRLFRSKEGLIVTDHTCGWGYFTHLVTVSKEKPYRVSLSDETKLLIAGMKLQSAQDTAPYHVLQGISSAVDRL